MGHGIHKKTASTNLKVSTCKNVTYGGRDGRTQLAEPNFQVRTEKGKLPVELAT